MSDDARTELTRRLEAAQVEVNYGNSGPLRELLVDRAADVALAWHEEQTAELQAQYVALFEDADRKLDRAAIRARMSKRRYVGTPAINADEATDEALLLINEAVRGAFSDPIERADAIRIVEQLMRESQYNLGIEERSGFLIAGDLVRAAIEAIGRNDEPA